MQGDFAKFISLLIILLLFGLALFLANANFVLASSQCLDQAICRIQNAELIKSKGNPTVYAIINGKKHTIPNEEVFLNYGFKWQDIKIVSNKEISSYPDLKLVKTEDNPTVYYLNTKQNLKKAHTSEKVFLDYGNKWEDVVIISQNDLATYNDAYLVKPYGKATVYALEKNTLRPISSPLEFENFGFKWEDIIEISHLDLESYNITSLSNNISGANINQSLNNTASEISQTTSSRGKLNISLSNYLSKNNFIAAGSVGEFTEFKLENLQGDISINELTVTAFGIIASEDIKYLYITDKDDDSFYYKTTAYDKKARFIFDEPLLLNEGEAKTLILKAAINKNNDIAYRTIGFGINNADDISVNASVYGNFPINGLAKEIRRGEGILGEAEINAAKLNFEKINPGAKNQKVAEFIVREKSGNEDILIEKIAFYLRGNIKSTDFIGLNLVDDNRRTIATSLWINPDGRIEFDLTRNPFKVYKSSSKSISLQADVLGKGDKNFEFFIKDNSDVKITGALSQTELITNITTANNYSNLIIKKGSVFAFLNQDSPESLIAGSKNAILAIFDLKGLDTDIALKNFTMSLNFTGTPLPGDIIITNGSSGEKLYSINAASLARMGKAEVNLAPAQKINLNGILKLKIQTDIPEEPVPNTNYSIILNKFGFDDLQNELYILKFQEVSSKILAVKKSALYITPEGITNSYIAGSKNVLIGEFSLQANYSEDIYIDHISIKSKEGYDEATSAAGFYNLRLNLGNTPVKEPLKIPIGFDFKYPYRVSAGNSIILKVYADTYPTASGNTIALAIADIGAYGKESKSKPKIDGLNTNSSPLTFSQLDFELLPNTDFENEINCGNNKKIGSFVMKASGENIQINELIIEAASQSDIISYQNGYSNLKLKTGTRTLGTISKPFPEFNIFKTNFTITDEKETIIDVYADIPECCDCDERNLQVMMKITSSYGASSKVTPKNPNATSNMVKVVCDCAK